MGNHGRHGRDGRCVFGYHGLGRNAKLELGDQVLQGSTDSIIKQTRRQFYKLFLFRQAHTHTQTQSSTHTLLTHSLGSREGARVRGVAQGKDVGVLLVLQGALVDVDEALFLNTCEKGVDQVRLMRFIKITNTPKQVMQIDKAIRSGTNQPK